MEPLKHVPQFAVCSFFGLFVDTLPNRRCPFAQLLPRPFATASAAVASVVLVVVCCCCCYCSLLLLRAAHDKLDTSSSQWQLQLYGKLCLASKSPQGHSKLPSTWTLWVVVLGWVGLGWGICLRSVARVGMLVCGLHLVNCAPLKGRQHCGVYQRLEQLFISTLITGSTQAG